MKIGFGLPVSGSWATREHMARVAVRAEELGYHSLWSFQRLLSPKDGVWGEQYRSVHAPLIPLAYAAALTERVRLGVAVVNLPFVNPAILAKEVSSLDVVSGGRTRRSCSAAVPRVRCGGPGGWATAGSAAARWAPS